MFKEWLTAFVGLAGAGFGGVVAIIVKYRLDSRAKKLTEAKEAQKEQATAEATVKIATMQADRDIRVELWTEIKNLRDECKALRDDLDNMDVRLLAEVQKNAECERKAIRLEAKVSAQSDRIQLLEKQNIELNKILLAANLSLPVASPIVLHYEDGGGESIG